MQQRPIKTVRADVTKEKKRKNIVKTFVEIEISTLKCG